MSDYLKQRQQWNQTGKPIKEKKVYKIPKVSKKKAAEKLATNGGEQTELQKWYAKIMKKEDAVCWETGEKINKNDKLGWHGSIAHVLPKAVFPSVATHPLNYLILSMWNGSHANYDSSWAKARTMKVWDLAMDRIVMMEPDLTEEERRKLPDFALEYINNNNPFQE